MTLQPDPTEKGLWRNPNVAKTSRGAHALIVGISRYPFLGGIPGNDWNTAGLEQLAVSASTAAQLFHWIDHQGAFGGTAIATCRLLLSPAPEEQASIDLVTDKYYRSANFSDIEASMRAWGNDIIGSKVGTDANVALFFFSGHGIENRGRHHLLAQDVLDQQSASGPANAIEVEPIMTALRGFGINTGFLLLDACRNNSYDVRGLGIEGRPVLTALIEALPGLTALTAFKATGSGKFAYQRPTDPATIFGQAVLQSLEGLPPEFVPYDRRVDPWKLAAAALDKFLKQHVRQQLASILSNSNQPTEMWGCPYDEAAVVALRRPPDAAPPASETIPAPSDTLPAPGGSGVPRDVPAPAPTTATAPPGETPPAPLAERTARTFSHFQKIPLLILDNENSIGDPATMRQILGHDHLINHWLGTLTITDADSGEPISASMLRVSQAHRAESSELVTVWMDIPVPRHESRAFWVQSGSIGDNVCAVILPSDPDEVVPARLDVTYLLDPKDPLSARLHSMTARIGEPKEGEHDWQVLWDAQREEQVEGLGAALDTLNHSLEWLRGDWREFFRVCPVVTAAAWTTLLRGGNFSALGQLYWRARHTESIPDLVILQIETLRLMHEYNGTSFDNRSLEALFHNFVRVTQLRLPRFSRVVEMAARQIDFFSSCGLDNDLIESAAFRHGAHAILMASDYARSDSLYTALASENGLPHFFDPADKPTSDVVEGTELVETA
ncbi:caspase family protein [Paraburkholderia sp. SIMBA_049]